MQKQQQQQHKKNNRGWATRYLKCTTVRKEQCEGNSSMRGMVGQEM
jgi:hypothetical protein